MPNGSNRIRRSVAAQVTRQRSCGRDVLAELVTPLEEPTIAVFWVSQDLLAVIVAIGKEEAVGAVLNIRFRASTSSGREHRPDCEKVHSSFGVDDSIWTMAVAV
jgi:hypothetical protein